MMCETERMLSEHECHSTPKLTIIIVDPPTYSSGYKILAHCHLLTENLKIQKAHQFHLYYLWW